MFRELNERLVAAVRGDRAFEAALTFPRAADEDRADRIVDFEHLQVCLYVHRRNKDTFFCFLEIYVKNTGRLHPFEI